MFRRMVNEAPAETTNTEGLETGCGCTGLEPLLAWVGQELAGAKTPMVVGIGGPGGSGKSTVARWLCARLPEARLLSLDDFRVPRNQRPPGAPFGSHPDANDLSRLRQCLVDFRQGRSIRQPLFNAATGCADSTTHIPASPLLLADGEIAAHRQVREWLDRLILVETTWWSQLAVRLSRDLRVRRIPLRKALAIFLQSNLRDYPRFSTGAAAAADVILHRAGRRVFRGRISLYVARNIK